MSHHVEILKLGTAQTSRTRDANMAMQITGRILSPGGSRAGWRHNVQNWPRQTLLVEQTRQSDHGCLLGD